MEALNIDRSSHHSAVLKTQKTFSSRLFESLFTVESIIIRSKRRYLEMLLVDLKASGLAKEATALQIDLDEKKDIELPFMLGLECRVIAQLEGPALETKVESAIDMYRRAAGSQATRVWETRWAGILHASKTRVAVNHDETRHKREFLKQLVRETFNLYRSGQSIEEIKFKLHVMVGAATSVLVAILIAMFYSSGKVIWLLFIAGLSGAFLSIFHRISMVSATSQNIRNLIPAIYAPLGLVVSLLFGMVFPLLFVVLLSSGTLRGSLLPRIDSIESVFKPLPTYKSEFRANAEKDAFNHLKVIDLSILTNTTSETLTNYNFGFQPEDLEHFGGLDVERNFSKLILLSFICGFSERFLKDAIDSLARRIVKGSTTTEKSEEELK